MNRHNLLKSMIIFLLAAAFCYGNGDKVALSEADIDSKLFALEPLPKIHYYWPVSVDISEQRLYELARITHSVCIAGQFVTIEHIDRCVYTCARVNKTSPSIKCSIGVNFAPWAMKFSKDHPPTYRGPTYYEEIAFFDTRCKLIKEWINQSNHKYNSDVKVTALTLDTERFHEKTNDEQWNNAICEALNEINRKAKQTFPDARIEWYGRGVGQSAGETGWSKSSIWTGKEILESLSCSLYSVPEIERIRETYRKTAKLADTLGVEDITPWIALASGYRRGINDLSDQKFDFSWDYDIVYSYLLGREINIKWYGDRPERFAPYNRARVVVFYPPPFDKRTPDWAKHFIAYVRGATRVQDLKDLGYEQ